MSRAMRSGRLRVALALALAGGLLPAPAGAEPEIVSTFLDTFFQGCLRTPRSQEASRQWRHVYCLCSMSQVRIALDEPELEELARQAASGKSIGELPQFRRAVRRREECRHIGVHDDRPLPEGSLARALVPAKAFEHFRLALPDGFLYLSNQGKAGRTSYGFHRFHADLVNAATLQVTVVEDSGAADSSQAASRELARLLDELAAARTEWRAQAPTEARLGSLAARRAEWSARENGEPVRGVAYATMSEGWLVLVRIQDFERYAERTLPLMEASIATLRLR